jgi:putative oxidoreductase
MLHRISEQWGPRLSAWGPVALRIVAGIIFAYAGWQKFGNMDATIGFFAKAGIPIASFSAYLVTIVELVGGIALIAGLWTRVAAKLLGIIMLVATLLTLGQGFQMAQLPLTLLVVCFSLYTTGGGKYSMKA